MPSRDEALAHPRIDEFWEIVDYVLLTDPVVHVHVYGHELSTLAAAGQSFVLAVPGNGTTSSRPMKMLAARRLARRPETDVSHLSGDGRLT